LLYRQVRLRHLRSGIRSCAARLNPVEAGNRLANFIRATAEEVKILTMLSGHSDIRELSEEDLRAMEPNIASITGLKLVGYERRMPIWETAARTSDCFPALDKTTLQVVSLGGAEPRCFSILPPYLHWRCQCAGS